MPSTAVNKGYSFDHMHISFIIPILQERKLRHREVKALAQVRGAASDMTPKNPSQMPVL